MNKILLSLLMVTGLFGKASDEKKPQPNTQNIVIVTLDGMRW